MALPEELRLRLRASRGRGNLRRLPRPLRQLPPDSLERRYRTDLLAIIGRLEDAFRQVVQPQLAGLANQVAALRPGGALNTARENAWTDDASRLLRAMRLRVEADLPDPDRLAKTTAASVGAWNDREWRKVLRGTLGVEVFQREPWLKPELDGWATENASLITTLREDTIADVERWTVRALRAGERHEDVAKRVRERFGVAKSRAEFIARDQVSKLNGKLTERRQEALGVEEYIWRTTGDDRVRPSHAEKDGKKFRWDDPPADTGHPGEDYQCRCVAEPVLGPLVEAAIEEEVTA